MRKGVKYIIFLVYMKKRQIKRTRRVKWGGNNNNMTKCNNFCKTKYLDRVRKGIRKTFKNNPYIKPKSDAEIDKLLKNLDTTQHIKNCNDIFCSPNCREIGKNKKYNYVCPACQKTFPIVEKLGAITYCKYNMYV